MKKILLALIVVASLSSCVSTKSTLKNTDDNAPALRLTKNNTFVITEVSTDAKYGYNADYPINIFYRASKEKEEEINPQRYFNALEGPNGEKLFFKKIDTCCPFPTKHSEMGAGFLDMYEVRYVGIKKPIILYVNIYSKGKIAAPVGFTIKKN